MDKKEIVLHLEMTETPRYDGSLRGILTGRFAGVKEGAGYDDCPTEQLWWSSETPWYGFGVEGYYGHLKTEGGGGYGMAYGFQPDSGLQTLASVQRWHQQLKKASTAFDKQVQTTGQPQSLGQYVVYVLLATGITRVFVKVPDGTTGWQYKDYRELTGGMEAVRRYIDHIVDDCRARQEHARREKAATEAAA